MSGIAFTRKADIITNMSELTSENNCPHCGNDLVSGKMFCPTCGQALAPPAQKVAIDAFVTARVRQEIELLTKNGDLVVRDIGNRAEDEVWRRIKRYSWVFILLGALLGLYGFSSIQDAKKTIVAESLSRVEPVVKQVEGRALLAQEKLGQVEAQLPGVTYSLNSTATLADEQKKRVQDQTSEVSSKLNDFQAAARRADQLSSQFESSVNTSQKRLNDLTKRYDTQLTQISNAINHQAVNEAFPLLGEDPSLKIHNVRFDKLVKKPGEKWVNIYVTQDAMVKDVVTGKNLEQVVTQLRSLGFTPFLGLMFTTGRLNGLIENAGHGNPNTCQLYYYHDSFKPDAQRLEEALSKLIPTCSWHPLQADPSKTNTYIKPRLEFIIKDSRLDAQIYISVSP